MNCSEAEILLHALLDGELDAGHAREVEAHLAACPDCASKLAAFRTMREAMTEANLKEAAPLYLRSRIEAALPAPSLAGAPASAAPGVNPWRLTRRFFAGGFAMGAALSAAVAATLLIGVFRGDENQVVAGEVVSAHLRSLQPGHLIDVETSDQHTVKPWFNGKLDVAPPVVDLSAQGFTLVGGRLDDINGETAAAIVYRHRQHVINLFVTPHSGGEHGGQSTEVRHGFNIRHWAEEGLDFWAVSDVNADDLKEFCQQISAALHRAPAPS
jgi:anti-sigma factor (TIGR02949 family)